MSLLVLVPALPAAGQVQFQEKVSYAGWPNCIRLSNGGIELIVTTDVGPRVIRLGFVGGQNIFKEYREQIGKTGGDEWRIYGGHRLWHSPEASPRTYAPDNSPVKYLWDGKTLKLVQAVEPSTGIAKEIEISLDASENHVRLLHRLINRNLWEVELAPWTLTVMAQRGRAIFPQEPYRPHPDYLAPARPMVLWHYTDMRDPRWSWGTRYVQLRQDPGATTKQKVGILNSQGWAAYYLNGEVLLKRYGYDPGATYADFGCNTETFTDAEMIEVETLGPLKRLPPEGAAEHTEHWILERVKLGEDEASIDRDLIPLVRRTDKYRP
ncbi:MAG: hypothetical protein HXY20_00430 [Acidobacteria bacterium]|nr:hypothetical protein [Acidobacteriota bacterium]